MKEDKMLVEQGFYQACADLLGAQHAYRAFPYDKRSRWNNRTAGNGRFPGFGLIRRFGDAVHVNLRHPRTVRRWFASSDEALDFLATLPRAA